LIGVDSFLSNGYAPAMHRILCVVASGVLANCGGGSGSDGIGLGDLEGSYDITEPLDYESSLYETETPTCLLRVRGSRVTASCEKSDGERSESFSLDVTVQEETISGELVYSYQRGPSEDCYVTDEVTSTIAGSASKQNGSMTDGVFSAIGGTWDGNFTVEVSYDQELIASAPEYCADDLEIYAFSFDAAVGGNTAQIDWSGDDQVGQLEVVGTANALSVNGEVIPK
jgi:hypothetical protein